MSIIEKALDKLGSASEAEKDQKARENKAGREAVQTEKEDSHRQENVGTTAKTSRTIELDLKGLGKLGYLTPDTDNKVLFEQYRRIKLPVLKSAFEHESGKENKNIVMVTSSVAAEGKSFTSMNLAMSIAYEYNYTVLLIDADVTKQMSSKVMGVEGANGLIEYLTGKEEYLENLILRTNIPKLSLIPSGSHSDMVTELYSSNRMNRLIEELSTRYNDRLIIIDTPPVLEDSSAKVLTHLADQIVYIIEAEKTPRHVVENGLRMLNRKDSIGIVLNKSNLRHNRSYYYV
mgnify:CR=1 FL=1|jgi:exopolysaccharide/PEP-CTERM locus tyrosine autokinase